MQSLFLFEDDPSPRSIHRKRIRLPRPAAPTKLYRQIEFRLKFPRKIAFKQRAHEKIKCNTYLWNDPAVGRFRFQLLLDLEERFLEANFKDRLELLMWMVGPEDEPFSFFHCISQHGLPRFIANAGFRHPDEVVNVLRDRMSWLTPVFTLPDNQQVPFLKALIARHEAGETFQ